MTFEGFRTITLTIGMPSVSFTSNGTSFSKAAVAKLEYPRFVQLLLNDETKQMAIVVCEKDVVGASPFMRESRKNKSIVRWNNRDFLRTIEKLMGWDLDQNGYRVYGDYIVEERAILFDLKTAEQISGSQTEETEEE